MSVAFKLIARRPALPHLFLRRRGTPQWRSYSTPAEDTLPLKGVRVLDMTRVLAGVSSLSSLFTVVWHMF